MLVKSPAGMVVYLNEQAKDEGGGSRAGVTERLRRVFNDALEYGRRKAEYSRAQMQALSAAAADLAALLPVLRGDQPRSEEHTSELQSRLHLVCRLLLEKKKKQ